MALTVSHDGKTFNVGDIVRVHQKTEEVTTKGTRTRTQVFQGMVIATRGEGQNKSFTVRRVGVGGIGIERIFPVSSPLIESVDVVGRGAVRRAKLYYLRGKSVREVTEVTKKYSRRKGAQVKRAKTSKKRKK